MKTIAFDCDGTLQDHRDHPRLDIIAMLEDYRKKGWNVIIWSGGGAGYARGVARRLGITGIECFSKFELDYKPDVAVDDQNVNLGIENIRV